MFFFKLINNQLNIINAIVRSEFCLYFAAFYNAYSISFYGRCVFLLSNHMICLKNIEQPLYLKYGAQTKVQYQNKTNY